MHYITQHSISLKMMSLISRSYQENRGPETTKAGPQITNSGQYQFRLIFLYKTSNLKLFVVIVLPLSSHSTLLSTAVCFYHV